MLKFDATNTICTLRDALCPAKTPINPDGSYPGIVFCLDVRLGHYRKNGKEHRRSAMVFIAFCGNTNVFVAIEPNDPEVRWLSYRSVPLDAWENTSNHDSCWRSDGLQPLSKLFFRFCEEINNEMPESEQVAPKDMSDNTALGFLMSQPFTLVTIKHEPTARGEYRRRMVEISQR